MGKSIQKDERTSSLRRRAKSGAPDKELRNESTWAPGVVHVEFKVPRMGERMMAISAAGEKFDETNMDSQLLQIFLKYNLVDFEPTFPLSNEERDERVRAYRRRFITFYFQPSEDLATKAVADLRALPYVARAGAMPRLAPARSVTANEPLLGNVGTLPLASVYCGAFKAGSARLGRQWYIFRSRVDQAWALTNPPLSGNGVVLADVDWGFRTNHEDLAGRINKTFNTVTNGVGVSNGSKINHGTAVLGMAGAALNGRGIAGIANQAGLWAIQAGDDLTGVDVVREFQTWVAAIDLIRNTDSDGRRKVLMLEAQTLAKGNVEMSIPINQAIVDAIRADVVVCVAAGNGETDASIGDDGHAIDCTGSILVGATDFDPDPTINRRGRSNFGPRVTVYAPGDEHNDVTCSGERSDKYTNCFGGTSGATAKVGGVVALMLEANPALKPADVESILRQTGSLITDDEDPNGVFLDAGKAVGEALLRGQPDS
jgi:subtilisin family serine protease